MRMGFLPILLSTTLLLLLVAQSLADEVPANAKCLRQADFDHGTLIIDRPGAYKLCQDISFKPYPHPIGDVMPAEAFLPDYSRYDEFAFGLGFFAAICIATERGVDLYLNGFTIEQSPEHALMQRFFSIIEIGGSPFITGAGPAEFVGEGSTFQRASNVRILGPGTIGRSSHHGIHGNECENIVIRGVTFVDFEVGAVSLNNVHNLLIEQCNIPNNRHDVPVVGLFSAAVFLVPYAKYLKDYYPERSMTFADGTTLTSEQLYSTLTYSINDSYFAVIEGRNVLDPLYRNPRAAVEGPCYAFLVHGKGPAINDFGFDPTNETSSNVIIRDNDIRSIKCWNKEVPAHFIDDTIQNDARGAVFQMIDTFTNEPISRSNDGHYVRNMVSDMQLFVAQAIHDKVLPEGNAVLQTAANTIDRKLIEWATTPGAKLQPNYRCNGDSMHHVVKGVATIRVDQTIGFQITNNRIRNIYNLSVKPFQNCADGVHGETNEENAVGDKRRVGNIRAISVAASRGYAKQRRRRLQRLLDSDPPAMVLDEDDEELISSENSWDEPSIISGNTIENIMSLTGFVVIGIDIQGATAGVDLRQNVVSLNSWEYPETQYLSLRVRGSASDVSVSNQDLFFEPVLIEKTGTTTTTTSEGEDYYDAAPPDDRRRRRRLSASWEGVGGQGGCPLARIFFRGGRRPHD